MENRPAGFALAGRSRHQPRLPKPTRTAHSLRVTTSSGRDRRSNRPALRLGPGPGSGARAGPSDAAKLRTASAPDLAMLVVPGCPVCVRCWGEKDAPFR